MNITAIGGLVSQGMPLPTAQGEMTGFFGMTLKSALENVSSGGLPKKGLKEEDLTAICYAMAGLISANLLQNMDTLTLQDVQEWVMGAMDQGSIPMEDLLALGVEDPMQMQQIVDQINQLIAQEDQSAGPSEFDIVFKVLNEIHEHVVHEQQVATQLQQDAPAKIAGEMRVIEADKQSDVPVIEDSGKEAKTEDGEIGAKSNLYPVGADTKFEQDVDLVFDQVQTDNVADTVLDKIETALSTGKNKLFIKLRPDVLGGIAMKLTMSDEGLVARIVTTNQQTQNILNTQISDLENTLRDRGIQVESMEISYNAMNEDTRKQGSQPFQQSKQSRQFEISSIDTEDTESLMDIYNMMMAPADEAEATIYRA